MLPFTKGRLCHIGVITLLAASVCQAQLPFTKSQMNLAGVRTVGVGGISESVSSNAPIVQVAASPRHAIYLRSDGTVVCAGDGPFGANQVPPGLAGVVQVAASGGWAGWSLALLKNGTVTAWGYASGSGLEVPAGLSNIRQIGAGWDHAVALTADKTVVCWGSNAYGQLNVPIGLSNVVSIAVAANSTVALRADGTVVTWGDSTFVPVGLTNVVQVAISDDLYFALRSNGTAVCWNRSGQLAGDGYIPTSVDHIKQITAGYRFSMVLKDDGKVLTFGYPPLRADELPHYCWNVKQVAASSGYSMLFNSDGRIRMQGFPPVQTPFSLSGAAEIAGTGYTTAARKFDGKVEASIGLPAELSDVKQLGFGDGHVIAVKVDGTVVDYGNSSTADVPLGLTGVIQAFGGTEHSVALRADGTVVCWGKNGKGQLNVPAGLTNVKQVSTFGYHTLALRTDGTVVAWGSNGSGECAVPAGLSGVRRVAAGDYFSVALKDNGQIVAWGANSAGQCNIPSGLKGVVDVSAGTDHVVAVRENGTAVSWGNDFGNPLTTPVGLGPISQASAGRNRTIYLPQMSVEISPYSCVAGASGTGYLYLSRPAPVGGATVGLASGNTDLTLPSSVQVPDGEYRVPFIFSVKAGAKDSVAIVTASFSGTKARAALTIASTLRVDSVTLPDTIRTNEAGLASINLNAPVPASYTVLLESNNSKVKVPSSVTFQPGEMSASFKVTGANNPSTEPATITATNGSTTASAKVSLLQNLMEIDGRPYIVGGTSDTVAFQVRLWAPSTKKVTLHLMAKDPSVVSVPSTIVIPIGQTSAALPIFTNPVAINTPQEITVSGVGPDVTYGFVVRPNEVESFEANVKTFVGGSATSVTCKVQMVLPVSVDTVVNLTSDTPSAASLPSGVIILAGSSSATVVVTHYAVASGQKVRLKAKTGLISKSVNLNVEAASLASLSVSPPAFVGGSATSVTGTVTLSGPAAADMTISLTSNLAGVSVPASVVVLAGQTSAAFNVGHSAVPSNKTAVITAVSGSITKKFSLTVKKA